MPLLSSSALERMVRDGVTILKITPAISRADFLVALALTGPYVGADWNLAEDILENLGYVAPAASFSVHASFWTATTNSVERNIRSQMGFEFQTFIPARIAALEAQRDVVQAERNLVRDTIQDDLQPWLAAPPVGTPQAVIDAVQKGVQEQRLLRDGLTRSLDDLNSQIANLGG